MVSAGSFRRQQQEDQVDGLIIDRFERNWALEPGKDAIEPVETGKLAVRDSDPGSDAGRAESLSFDQDIVDRTLVNAPIIAAARFASS